MTKIADNANNIRFFYNGLKVGKGKLQKGHWSLVVPTSAVTADIPPHITLYGRGLQGFSTEICEAFGVENNSDSMTDYFENDRIKFSVNHPRFIDAAAALTKRLSRDIARCEKQGNTEWIKTYKSELAKLEDLTKQAPTIIVACNSEKIPEPPKDFRPKTNVIKLQTKAVTIVEIADFCQTGAGNKVKALLISKLQRSYVKPEIGLAPRGGGRTLFVSSRYVFCDDDGQPEKDQEKALLSFVSAMLAEELDRILSNIANLTNV